MATMDVLPYERETPVRGDLDVRWIHGARNGAGPEPPLQVHWYDAHTAILRQSKLVSYEAPFLYLLFGNERAVLFDTGATPGATEFPLRQVVDALVDEWLSRHGRVGCDLVVAHTHGHSDHVAGDRQFATRRATMVVGKDVDAVVDFFGFRSWPDDAVFFDLGGRRLEIIGIPGHHPSSIAVYDPWTGLLLTGDSVYPGRLYVPEFASFRDSLDRLVALAERRTVSHVMGCHIEMTTTPRRDYPIGEVYQPDEPSLQMTVDQLRAVRRAANGAALRPGVHRFDDFIIYNGPCRREMTFQLCRSALSKDRRRALARAKQVALELKQETSVASPS